MSKQNHILDIRANKLILIFIFIPFFFTCTKYSLKVENPLAIVIKYNSASELLLYDEAEKYIDIELAFGQLSNEENSTKKLWKEYLDFNNNMGQTKKFSNRMNYCNYTIYEYKQNGESKVEFNRKDGNKSIIYTLKRKNSKWIIVKIDYYEDMVPDE